MLATSSVRDVEQTLEFIPQCHIASMVIQCKPDVYAQLVSTCGAMENSKVYTDKRDTAFVFVVERASEGALRKTIDELNSLVGVINVNMVYHQAESEQSLSEELSS